MLLQQVTLISNEQGMADCVNSYIGKLDLNTEEGRSKKAALEAALKLPEAKRVSDLLSDDPLAKARYEALSNFKVQLVGYDRAADKLLMARSIAIGLGG
jgi:hypothetical protein